MYKEATLPWEWTSSLKEECDACGIDFFSTPYDLEAVDMLDPYVEVFKIGSGDITWPEMIVKVAAKEKPVFAGDGGFGHQGSAARRRGNSQNKPAVDSHAMQYKLHR